ncbi:MAG: PKD domain-containing protein, partial [Anaerolineales bacterium]|nr:PKD domain-containing protein [Anaerolineales bacterium]
PLANSATGSDYPIFVDVDGDSYAEIIVPTIRGVVVFGQDGVWGETRPLWNEHSYHITNVNDDLTISESEVNSWAVHNTYRTQWPQAVALPVYDVTLTHTVGISGVTVLTDTFATPPSVSADPDYRWDYVQTSAQPVVTQTFVSELADLQPGETRLVAEGTAVSYTLPSGVNFITLPPLYVSAPRIAALTPESATAFAGATAVYTLTLINPGSVTAVYTLTANGPVADWLTLPTTANVPAGGSVVVPVTVAIPVAAALDTVPLIVDVTTDNGGHDAALADLTVQDGLEIAVSPPLQNGRSGQPLYYTLTLTNLETAAHTYTLAVTGTASVDLPAAVSVPGNGTESVSFTATPLAEGPQPFTIQASGASGVSDQATAVAVGIGRLGVQVGLLPDTAVTGLGGVLTYTLAITNVGTLRDSYALDVGVPANWTAWLQVNGAPVTNLTIPAGAFNRVELLLLVQPDAAAVPGVYDVGVTAVSQALPLVTAATMGTAEVLNLGVQVAFTGGPAVIEPDQTAVWDVTVTNTGSSADTFDLMPFGTLASFVQMSATTVTLNPGQAQTVQLTGSGFVSLLPELYELGMLARSQTNSQVLDDAKTAVTLNARQAVLVSWQPVSRTVTNTLQATMMLVVTNTGNVLTTYELAVTLNGGTAASLPEQLVLPPGQTVWTPILLRVLAPGAYDVVGTAVSADGTVSDSATATLIVAGGNQAPLVDAGPDQQVALLEEVQFAGSATDPDGDPLISIVWEFGDGETAVDTLTPAHTYLLPGVYTVTLTVGDDQGHVSTDTLVVTVEGTIQFLPIIVRAP